MRMTPGNARHEYKAHARRLREFVHYLSTSAAEEHEQVLDDRRAEIRDAGDELRRGPLKMLGSAAGIGLGIAGRRGHCDHR
jgi:hypothetical protein